MMIIAGLLMQACSMSEDKVFASQTVCKEKQCPLMAIKESENKNYSLFFDVENDNSEIEQVNLVLDNQQHIYKLADENVEYSNTGESTYIVLNVNKDLVDSLVAAENSSLSIKTKSRTFNGIIRTGQQESELYKAAKEFKSKLN
ncbi:hypothetical protein [Acinetobacter defluvii]|nr:hypothetical protein [Acinetobacter defluvii]